MATQMMVRIDPELKSRFNKLARAEGKTTSQMVRELMGIKLLSPQQFLEDVRIS